MRTCGSCSQGTAGGHERSWETSFSVLHLFSPSVEAVNINSWLYGAERERGANTVDENGLCPLIYAAGCAHSELFKSLLQQTNLNTVHSILKDYRTTLLHVIVEAPLARGADGGAGNSAHEQTPSLQRPRIVRGGGTLDSSLWDSEEELDVVKGDVKTTLRGVADHQEFEERKSGTIEAPPPTHGSTVEAPPPTHGNSVDNDSASLQCLRSLQNYDR